MKKLMKKAVALLLAAVLIVGSGMTVMADDADTTPRPSGDTKLNSSATVTGDTSTITLFKNYIRKDGSATDSNSPAEIFTFTVTPYAVWNAGSSTGKENDAAYTVSNMPLFGSTTNGTQTPATDSAVGYTTYTISADAGYAGNTTQNDSVAMTVPTFNSVGDFWYSVVETDKKTTGVTYATNDADTKDRTYYIHVQVTNGDSGLLRTVTLHQKAPTTDVSANSDMYNTEVGTYSADGTSTLAASKVQYIENTYSAGKVNIKKTVTGNAGDKNKRFKVTVTFTKPANTIITSDITYEAATSATATAKTTGLTIYGQDDNNNNAETVKWTPTDTGATMSDTYDGACTSTVEIWLKNDETVTFKNVPYDVTYTVQEADYTGTNGDYELASYAFDNATETGDTATNVKGVKDQTATYQSVKAEGKVSDASDLVTITNTKNSTIDIGVLTSNAPYVAVLVAVAFVAVMAVRRRRNGIDD